MSAFKGFQKTGGFQTSVRSSLMFSGFTDTIFGQVGNIGGVPTTGLVAWFNPSVNVTQSGGAVSQWQDTSGAYTWSGGTGTQQPTLVQGDPTYNGRPYFTTDGVHQYFNMAATGGLSIQGNRTYQVIFIGKYISTSGAVRLMQSDISGDGTFVINEASGSNQVLLYINDVGTLVSITNPINIDTNMHTYGMEIDRQSAGLAYMSVDNQWRNASGSIGNSSTSYAAAQLWMGINGTLVTHYSLQIFDVLFYNTLLSKQDYLMLVSYMKSLYNF